MRELKTPKTSILLLSLFSFHLLSLARDTLTLNQSLADGETLISSGGAFALGFFSPSNTTNRYLGIWYNNIKVHTIVWVANRQNPVPNSSAANLTLTTTGDLVITHNASGGKIWSSITANTTNPILQLLDSGNLVIREDHTAGGSEFLWQSFDYPTDTLLPGMKLGWDLTKGLNRNLTAWRTLSDPAPGPYTISMDIRGDPGLAMFRGTTRLWRSGPWNGLEITGIPEMLNYTGFAFHFIDNATDIYYSYDITDPTITTRLVVNGSSGGMAQRYVWLDDPGEWGVFWYTPKTPCDVFSPCGPYGLCDPNANPMCSCLEGFKPKNVKDWQASNGTGGCVRKTALGCERNGTVSDGGGDGFMRMKNAWLPDTTVVTVNRSMSVEECREACFKNCSCTGYAAADVRDGGSGCLIWAVELQDLEFFVNGGQDLYIRLAASDLAAMSPAEPQDSHKNRAKTAVTATVSVLLGVILLVCIGCFAWRRTKRMKTRGINGGNYGPWQDENRKEKKDLELPLFDLDTVMVATDNFRPENKLGEGGYGPVYKGKLGEGQEIAVKRLSDTSIQGADEFKNEVTLIAKLQHRNLVRLLGCCVQGDERMLIYEYMHNKSLDFFLFGNVDSVHLDWSTRFRIIVGIARGLLYLHQDSRFRIIHRDLKASNILLDKEMIPKISDFGLARIFGGDEAITKTRRVVGTYGYMSPEYAMDGIFSVKSDVFSFGVLVLEIISGRKNKGAYISDPHLYLLGCAWNLWSEGKSVELIDPTLSYSFSNITEIMRCIKVGLLCVQEGPEDRPTMPMVLLMLSSDSALLPDPKPPGFVAKKNQCESNPSSTEKELNSVNEVTITMSVGR